MNPLKVIPCFLEIQCHICSGILGNIDQSFTFFVADLEDNIHDHQLVFMCVLPVADLCNDLHLKELLNKAVDLLAAVHLQ